MTSSPNYPPEALSETDYKHAWQRLGRTGDTAQDAFAAGAIATCLSQVFIGAYQAAQRACAARLSPDRWYAFAVSEDRSGKQPGVTLQEGRLSGTKVWIASSDLVDEIILVAGARLPPDAACWLVPANLPGVTILTRPPASFLGDMSQGAATLREVSTTILRTTRITGDFGLAEAFHVSCAGLGYVQTLAKQRNDRSLHADASALVPAMTAIAATGFDRDVRSIADFHGRVKALGKSCAASATTVVETDDWRRNGRLLGMYGKALNDRLA
ncbi:MAG: hypothetical protein H6993_07280 [Pseudomonadales bacterium]|nr:hypothetical protein [Pseudomonadales bacterium]MCP5183748.1 hypothetical protein [Pseudomonadales bacterium]